MEGTCLPLLPDDIICKIITMVGRDSFWHLAPFIRAGKRGYGIVYQQPVLQTCNVGPMINYPNCEIRIGGQFRDFFLKCVNVGNPDAVYYEGLYVATFNLDISLRVLEPNVPNHALSMLAAGIFNVCLSKDKEATQVFQQFGNINEDLRSDGLSQLATEI